MSNSTDRATRKAAAEAWRYLDRIRRNLSSDERLVLAGLEIALGVKAGPSLELRAVDQSTGAETHLDACNLRAILDANPDLEGFEISHLLRLALGETDTVDFGGGAAGFTRAVRLDG